MQNDDNGDINESLSIEDIEDLINQEDNNKGNSNQIEKTKEENEKGVQILDDHFEEIDIEAKNNPLETEKGNEGGNSNDYYKYNEISAPDKVIKKYDSNKAVASVELANSNQNPIPNTDAIDYDTSNQNQMILNNKNVFKLTTNNTHNNTYNNTTMNNKNSINVRNPVPMSKLQQVENKYYKLKGELDAFLSNTPASSNEETDPYINITLSKQNAEMISYLDQLNSILSSIIANTKISIPKEQRNPKPKKPSLPSQQQQQMQEAQIQINTNNAKLVDAYKKECIKLENRLKQVSDPNYVANLEAELKDINDSLTLIEFENKQLKQEQKRNEIIIEKQNKNNNANLNNKDMKRLTMDIESLKRQNQTALTKIDKRKVSIRDNEIQINQLKELKDSLEKKAQEMYNITEYENVKEEEKNEKKIQDQRNHLKRKIEVLERVLSSNKKKYEMEIGRNEKNIYQLRIDKNELNEQLIKKEAESALMIKIDCGNNKEEKKINSIKDIKKEELIEAMNQLETKSDDHQQKIVAEQISRNTSGVVIKKNITKPKFDFKPIKQNSITKNAIEDNNNKPFSGQKQVTDYGKSGSKDIKENIIVSNNKEEEDLPNTIQPIELIQPIEAERDNNEVKQNDDVMLSQSINLYQDNNEEIKPKIEEKKNIIEYKGEVPEFLADLNEADDYERILGLNQPM